MGRLVTGHLTSKRGVYAPPPARTNFHTQQKSKFLLNIYLKEPAFFSNITRISS